MMLKSLFAVVFLMCLMGGCAASQPKKSPPVTVAPEHEDVKIGRQFRREAKKVLKFITNPEVDRFVARLGQSIVFALGPQQFDYRFFVVKDRQLNAFAVPGGSIYVFSGLLERAKSTDQLVSVLAHEVVHVNSRHMARLSEDDLMSILGLLGSLVAAAVPGGQAIGLLGQGLAMSQQLSYTRQMEREADTLGVKYMTEAGYDPKGALGMLKLMNQDRVLNPVDIPPYLMTHPVTQDRIANVRGAIRVMKLSRLTDKGKTPDPLKRVQVLLRLEREGTDSLIREFKKAVENEPDKSEPRHFLALAYHHREMWEEAQKNYDLARSLNSDSPGIDRDLGRLYTRTGSYSLARQALNRSLKVDPREPLNYFYLGELLEKEENFRDALGAFLRAHQLSPLWADPLRRLGTVYSRLDRWGDAHYTLGQAFLVQDEDEKAIAEMIRAVKIFGESSHRGQLIREELAAIRARE